MLVKAIKNHIGHIDKQLREYAFTQDEWGNIDVTIKKKYVVYGIQKNTLGTFYLVLTDTQYPLLPWWMPAELYKIVDDTIPTSWQEKVYEPIKKAGIGGATVTSHPEYFKDIEDIEDGTPEGYRIFEVIRKDAEE